MVPCVKNAVWSWKILLNGRLDERLYAIGAVRENLPLAEPPEFSRWIREGLSARFSAP
jgi:hypothetical protein